MSSWLHRCLSRRSRLGWKVSSREASRSRRDPSSRTAPARYSRTSPPAAWEIEVSGVDSAALGRIVEAALAASSLPVRRERKGREEEDDLRPSVRELCVVGTSDGPCVLGAELATASSRCAALGARAGARDRARPLSQDPSMDRERRLAHRASRAGRSSASCGLGACVMTSSRRDLPNVRHPGRQRGECTIGTDCPGI